MTVVSRLYRRFRLVALPTGFKFFVDFFPYFVDPVETVKPRLVDRVKNASARYANPVKNHEIGSELCLLLFPHSKFTDSINRMAYVRANNKAQECIIENYQVLKLEKYVLESTELEARKTENEFRNRNKKLKTEVTLKRKHHAEASSHYNLCIAQVQFTTLSLFTI